MELLKTKRQKQGAYIFFKITPYLINLLSLSGKLNQLTKT